MSLKQTINRITHRKQKSISSATIVLAITFAFSALLGFLRSRFLYSHFFACCAGQLDAYNAAFRLPDLIFKLLVSGALSASFIPVFSGYLHRDKATADKIASTVINLLSIIFIIACILVFIFTYPFSRTIAAGFTPDQHHLMVQLTRVLLLAQIFFLVSSFLTSILQVHQAFLVPALSPIVYNLFIILSIFTLAPRFGIQGVTYGVVVGAFFHLAIQIPIIKRIGFNYSFAIDTKLKGVREVIRLMIPRTLSLGLAEIQNTLTLFFASTLVAGSLSLLQLAFQIMYLPSRIFGTTIGQASLPILSNSIAKNNMDHFRKTVTKILLQSLYIALPITVLILVQRLTIVRIAFGAKQFPWSATIITARALAFLTPAIICQSITQILIRSFYAMHNTKTPLHVSILSLLTNVAVSFYFITFTDLGIVGLALGASAREIIQCLGLLIMFIKIVDGFSWAETFSNFLKILFVSLLTGMITWSLIKITDIFFLDTTRTIHVFLLFAFSSTIGLIFYFVVSHLLHFDDFIGYRRYITKFKRFISSS